MHTIVLVHAQDPRTTSRLIDRAARTLRQSMPSAGRTLGVRTEVLPDCGVGWAFIEPAGEDPFASFHVDSDIAVLVYGRVEGIDQNSGAKACLQAWRAGGAGEVRRLHGVFAWIIVDRSARKVFLSSDSIANLGLYYAFTGDSLVVSPHDLGLLATGVVPFEMDPVQVHAALCRHWSPGGRSLLRSAERVPPNVVLCSEDGVLSLEFQQDVPGEPRLDTADTSDIKHNLDRLVDAFQQAVIAGIHNVESVDVTLSAGIDSRVVFAAALSATDRSRLHAMSSGSPNTTDVRTARKLATLANVEFHNSGFNPANVEQFVSNARLFAFCMNGDLCEGGSLFQIVPKRFKARTVLFGSGGEIYRGASRVTAPYRLLSAQRTHSKGPDAAEKIIMRAVNPSLDSLLNGDPQRIELAQGRVRESIDELSKLSRDPYDLLDLYYMYEKMGAWGKSKARQTWCRYQVPFTANQVTALAWNMPAPVGVHCPLHVEFLRRHMPEALGIPINGKDILAPANESVLHRIVVAWTRAKGRLSTARNRAARAIGGERSHARHKLTTDMGSKYQRLLQVDLRDYVDSMVCDGNSVAQALLGKQAVARVIFNNDTKTIIGLVILENWRQLATEIEANRA